MADLYQELGVEGDATPEEIRRAYRKVAKTAHPDGGGSREAWDRVNKAFNILSDASRRQRYDETGAEQEVDPREFMRAQAMTTVAGKMNALISDPAVDPRTFDLVLGIRELIGADRDQALTDIASSRSMQQRLGQFSKRLKRTAGDGPDRITPLITAQIEAHAQRILAIEDGLKVLVTALELVEDYVYEADKMVQVQVGYPNGWAPHPPFFGSQGA